MGEETIVVKPGEIDPGCVINLDQAKPTEQKKQIMKQLPNGVASDFGCVHPVPTQLDEATGIRFDFNDGLRLMMPPEDIIWHVTVYNEETGDVLGKEMLPANSCLVYPIKYYIRYHIHIEGGGKVLDHIMELWGKTVAFKMCQRTLGDPIALFCNIPYFCKKHNCNAVVYAPERIADIFRNQYPEIDFRLLKEEDTTLPYATYYLGLFFSSDENNRLYQPQDWRLFGLQEQSRNILGLSERLEAEPPKVDLSAPRSIQEKYVCVSYAGSKACKFWQNAYGWYEVTKHLKSLGYRILCIDRDPVYGPYPTCNYMPPMCEDFTGELPLQDRINIIKDADMFIGVASGLSWLAWCAKVPVILISGFSAPYMEFYTPYRVYNTMSTCTNCWGDARITFSHHYYNWCPRVDVKINAIKERYLSAKTREEIMEMDKEITDLEQLRFACTKQITGKQVTHAVNQVIADYNLPLH